MRETFAARFAGRNRDEWADHFSGTDACVAPVLSIVEAPHHTHNQERGTFVTVAGVTQPAPAPRFSSTAARIEGPPPLLGADTDAVAAAAGFSRDEIGKLRESGAIA
jgi:alpha-methylacyl-CoA racemase